MNLGQIRRNLLDACSDRELFTPEQLIGAYLALPEETDASNRLLFAMTVESFGFSSHIRHDPEKRELSNRYYRAAELLLRDAAQHGSSQARVQLGRIYRYDKGGGFYYQDDVKEYCSSSVPQPCSELQLQIHAFECFAAVADAYELASFELGKMYEQGIVCKKDEKRAMSLYQWAKALVEADPDMDFMLYREIVEQMAALKNAVG